jgi:hypothetical protein
VRASRFVRAAGIVPVAAFLGGCGTALAPGVTEQRATVEPSCDPATPTVVWQSAEEAGARLFHVDVASDRGVEAIDLQVTADVEGDGGVAFLVSEAGGEAAFAELLERDLHDRGLLTRDLGIPLQSQRAPLAAPAGGVTVTGYYVDWLTADFTAACGTTSADGTIAGPGGSLADVVTLDCAAPQGVRDDSGDAVADQLAAYC